MEERKGFALPTRELKEGRLPAFSNGDEIASTKQMMKREIASLAFAAAYGDELRTARKSEL